MNTVLGVDGGNTKTLALVARSDGTILGSGRAGCSDIYATAVPEAALAEIERAVAAALTEAGLQPPQLSAGVFSLAGADWPEDFRFLGQAMHARNYGRNIQIVNDAIGALRAGSPEGTGVVVACGTGAAVGGRGKEGQVWHSSFWQQTQGADELSMRALQAVYRAELGIDPPTALTPLILTAFAARDVEEVLHRLTGREFPRPGNWRQLVRPLLDAAEAGDSAARQIVSSHGQALGDYAVVAARRVGLLDERFTLVLTGGVLRHPSPLLRDALVARVQASAPGAHPVRSRFEPAAGAVLLALDLARIDADSALLDRLEKTLPGTAFYAT